MFNKLRLYFFRFYSFSKRFIIIFFLLVIISPSNSIYSQCAICKDSLLNKLQFYIDYDYTDSAQALIYDIKAKNLEQQKGPLFSFYVKQNQVEIFFFAGLLQFGIPAGYEALKIAHQLNDSLLIATTSEYMGLQYQELNNLQKADSFFRTGIRFYPSHPDYSHHRNKFGIANILQSMAEMQMLLDKTDSALYFNHAAMKKAPFSADLKISSIILFTYGDIYLQQNKKDSARLYYSKSLQMATDSNYLDIVLYNKASIAWVLATQGKSGEAQQFIQSGLKLLEQSQPINPFYVEQFFKKVIEIYEFLDDKPQLVAILKMNQNLQVSKNQRNNQQLQKILTEYTEKENQLIKLKLTESDYRKQKLQYYNLLLVIVIVTIIGWILFSRYKLRKQMEAQQAVANERTRITADLHDDIGATLSSMQIYGDLAKNVWDKQPEESKKMIDKISSTSKDLMGRMGDIIWSMKVGEEEKYTLEARLKNYSNELLSPKNIMVEFDIDEKLPVGIVNPEIRKNILLIAKEAMNNIAKYSGASKATVSLKKINTVFQLVISDNGKGFDKAMLSQGNGLNNIKSRCALLKGDCIIDTEPGKGVVVTCIFPIAIISHNG